MDSLKKQALTNTLLVTLYIIAVGSFMYYGSIIKIGRANTFLIPVALLLLFVCSAAITGFLIFGKSAMLYVDGKKKEAIKLLYYTICFFSVITAVALTTIIIFTR